MPLSEQEYQLLLRQLRGTLRESGLGAVDERIISDLRGSEGPFYDLVVYLKHLIEEVSLGSDAQLREVLRRIRNAVRTESDQPIAGVRVELSPEERQRYEIERIEFTPSSEFQEIAQELSDILEDLQRDYDSRGETAT
jgi:hypothetical protein